MSKGLSTGALRNQLGLKRLSWTVPIIFVMFVHFVVEICQELDLKVNKGKFKPLDINAWKMGIYF